jgi:hypothetical protein
MRLGQLSEKLQKHDSSFVKRLITENLDDVDTIKEIRDRLKEIMSEADNYATDNDFKYKYIQIAQKPLWSDLSVKPEHFIYQGFDAHVAMDLTENIDEIKPYVVVQNSNVSSLKDGQRLEINEDFRKSLNDFQREIFEESLAVVEQRGVNALKKVWQFEKERIDKWVTTCEVKLKGND